MKLDEEEKKKKELEKIRLKELEIIRERNRENKDKLNYIRQHANDKPANMSQYLFKALENKYNEKHQKEIQTEIIKKREKMKENSVSLEEIFDFEKKLKEKLKKKEFMTTVQVDIEERKRQNHNYKIIKKITKEVEILDKENILDKYKEEPQKEKKE